MDLLSDTYGMDQYSNVGYIREFTLSIGYICNHIFSGGHISIYGYCFENYEKTRGGSTFIHMIITICNVYDGEEKLKWEVYYGKLYSD